MSDWSIFDDIESDYLTITVTDHENDRYISAKVKERTWDESLTTFVQMLNGLGFNIKPDVADEVITEWTERNRKNG